MEPENRGFVPLRRTLATFKIVTGGIALKQNEGTMILTAPGYLPLVYLSLFSLCVI